MPFTTDQEILLPVHLRVLLQSLCDDCNVSADRLSIAVRGVERLYNSGLLFGMDREFLYEPLCKNPVGNKKGKDRDQ